MANPIENWLYKGATNPRSYYANMSLLKAMKHEIPFTKNYEGFNPRYVGEGKVNLGKYAQEGLKSLGGGQYGNIAGGTTGSRALYERFARGLPYIAKFLKRVPQAGFVSDALFGTDTQGSFARDINQALNVPLKKDGTVQTNIKDYRASQKSNVNQGGGHAAGQSGSRTGSGQISGPVGMGSAPIRSAPTGPDLTNRARGGLASLWQR